MFSVFWILYPLGTRLNWKFVSGQLGNMCVYFVLHSSGALSTATSLYIKHLPVFLRSYFRSFANVYHERCADSPWRLYRVSLFIVYSALACFLFAPVSLVVFTLAVGFAAVFCVLAVGVLIVWFVGLFPLAFLLWLLLYRIPVYDIIYPCISSWMLRQNSTVYHPLPLEAGTSASYIRLLRINHRDSQDTIDCELITENVAGADFDALSYVWGTAMLPHKIRVNGKIFYVTYNLFSALREFRRRDSTRLLWIDAICINQLDVSEKSSQVGLMKTIFSEAAKVLVWLGPGSKATKFAFDLSRQFADARTKEDRSSLWDSTISSRSWRHIGTEFNGILSHDWWSRVWIVQEVAVARHIVIHRGSMQIDWDILQPLFNYDPFRKTIRFSASTFFVDEIQQLRDDLSTGGETPTELFDLVYRFRHQFATLGSDKIYALLGLLPPGCSTMVSPDYNKSPEQVYFDLTLASLVENKSFSVIALAPGSALQGVSWCRDWRIPNDGLGLNPMEYFSMYSSPLMKDYCTTGKSEPQVEANLSQRVLKAKGFDLDVVIKRGGCITRIGNHHGRHWGYLLQGWERVAGGPWSSSETESLILSDSFTRTIVADRWSGDIVDWKREIEALDSEILPNEDTFPMAITRAGINRRFFVTQSGRFGLGPWNLQVGDALVAFLGSTVPFLLRQDDGSNTKRPTSGTRDEFRKERWRVVGEAYCDGLMYYEGDIDKDIHNNKKVDLRDYDLI
ncbi:heterokaryon incompatibility protein-domain-containing protein [Nemania sp. FL0916]|nr:heterokaryon incompatibility protein-domain-containing protein [Nemania sp. FL0916]